MFASKKENGVGLSLYLGQKVETQLLPGRPPWSMEWVSLQRFDSATELVSSMGCDERDVSTDTFYQTPVAEGANPFKTYTCAFHTYSLKMK